MTDILLITPPFTQLNTPYPATAYLKGFLNTRGISSCQSDVGIEVINAIFCKTGLENIFRLAHTKKKLSANSMRILALDHEYLTTIDEVISFLQGENDGLARKICTELYLPQASRFKETEYMEWAFGFMGLRDKAKHLATLYFEDLCDFITETIDPFFGVNRYAESLGTSANSFDGLYTHLQSEPSYIDSLTTQIIDNLVKQHSPKLVCFSVPFPGNLVGALRGAQHIKKCFPDLKIAMGGGYANTELRTLKDKRVFGFFDFISLDDGELPIELIFNAICKKTPEDQLVLKRTFHLQNDTVHYNNFSLQKDYKQDQIGTPDYGDLHLDKYISVIEQANPMHTLWSDGVWLKLTMAHGCYWGKCTFCDISLPYIGDYEPNTAKVLVDRMEQMMKQTGRSGFHFVDEAAPPALMRELALEIIRRGLQLTWWTNIRFEKSFTAGLCRLLQASGCIAVSGGLEVASNRLLKLIDKGVTVEQVAQVTRNFTEKGILVHSYLMYGYPTQTQQETIDSLEMVRQLFELGLVQSGFWHQFSLTAHSPIGLNPDAFGVLPKKPEIQFAHNDVDFEDETGIAHEAFSFGLSKSLYNYMLGIGFENDLQDWFDFEIPETTIPPEYILDILEKENDNLPKSTAKMYWIGAKPKISEGKKTITFDLYNKRESYKIKTDIAVGIWLQEMLLLWQNLDTKPITFREFEQSYTAHFEGFEDFWYSSEMQIFQDCGLIVI